MVAVQPSEISINDRTIGIGHPCFVIAEAGVNHNGSLELARQLVFAAKRAGADSVKFQTFKAERVVTRDSPKADYQLLTTSPTESQYEMLRKLELDLDAYQELINLCSELELVFISTPYNTEDVDFLDELGVAAFKLASIHIAEPSFLQYVARKGKPMIISTGMATLAEVDTAIHTIRETGNDKIVLLQCTTNYPSRLEDANLLAMQTMHEAFGVLVGYSDHTQTDTACIASIALGASVIEKHLTIDKSLPGPDQSTSYDVDEFVQLVRHIREAEMVLGTGVKFPTEAEQKNAKGMRRSIVVKETILRNEKITEEKLSFKRPGTGLPPKLINFVVNRRARRTLYPDTFIDFTDLRD